MANINVSWTPLANTVTDVDSIEVYRCDDLSKTTESEFQTALDSYFSDSSTNDLASLNLVEVETGLGATSQTLTSADSVSPQVTTTYYYCVVAKNQGGYKVGNGSGDEGAVDSILVTA